MVETFFNTTNKERITHAEILWKLQQGDVENWANTRNKKGVFTCSFLHEFVDQKQKSTQQTAASSGDTGYICDIKHTADQGKGEEEENVKYRRFKTSQEALQFLRTQEPSKGLRGTTSRYTYSNIVSALLTIPDEEMKKDDSKDKIWIILDEKKEYLNLNAVKKFLTKHGIAKTLENVYDNKSKSAIEDNIGLQGARKIFEILTMEDMHYNRDGTVNINQIYRRSKTYNDIIISTIPEIEKKRYIDRLNEITEIPIEDKSKFMQDMETFLNQDLKNDRDKYIAILDYYIKKENQKTKWKSEIEFIINTEYSKNHNLTSILYLTESAKKGNLRALESIYSFNKQTETTKDDIRSTLALNLNPSQINITPERIASCLMDLDLKKIQKLYVDVQGNIIGSEHLGLSDVSMFLNDIAIIDQMLCKGQDYNDKKKHFLGLLTKRNRILGTENKKLKENYDILCSLPERQKEGVHPLSVTRVS